LHDSRYDSTNTIIKRSAFVKPEKTKEEIKNEKKSKGETDTNFYNLMNAYYYDSNLNSPYQSEMMRKGRLLIEKMGLRPELNNMENLKWLVWELLNNYLKKQGYRCTLRLGMESEGPRVQGPFYFILMERWLESNYRFQVPYQEIKKGWWVGRFDEVGWHRLMPGNLKLQNQPLSKIKADEITKGNPYFPSDTMSILLQDFLSEMRHFKDGEKGSCIFDLQTILMKEIGRDLVIGLGMENANTCDMDTKYVRPEHDFSQSQFVVEIFDGFLRKLKRARICALHWYHWGEAGINMLDPKIEIRVGLA
jgi:hypothetical protein